MYNHFSEQMNKVLGFFTIKSVKETVTLPKSGSSTFPWFKHFQFGTPTGKNGTGYVSIHHIRMRGFQKKAL